MFALSTPFPWEDLPPDTQVLRSLLSPQIKIDKFHKNIYDFRIRNCLDGVPSIARLADSYSYTLLDLSFRLILALSAEFNLWISKLDISNAFQNTIFERKDRTYCTLPPFYLEWFKSRFPAVLLPTEKKLVLQTLTAIQGMRTAGKLFNDRLNDILSTTPLEMSRSASDYGMYAWEYEGDIVLVGVSTDDILIATKNETARKLIEDTIATQFKIKVVNEQCFKYLNWRIIQSKAAISADQSGHINSLVEEYFSKQRPRSCHIPFRTDSEVDDEIFAAHMCSDEDLVHLEQEYGASYAHTYGQLLHVAQSSRPDLSYPLCRLGYFQTVLCSLGFQSLRRVLRYLATHPNKPLIFPKKIKPNGSTNIRVYWSCKEYEDFSITNCLAAHQDTGFAKDKLMRSSYAALLHTFLGTAINWQVRCLILPVSSTDAELRILYMALLKTREIRALLQSIGVPIGDPTPHYEENEAVIHVAQAHRVTPHLKHLDLPVCYIHNEHRLGTFTAKYRESRFMIPDFMTKPHSGPSLLRMSAWSLGHSYLPTLPEWHYKELEKEGMISTLEQFLPAYASK